MSDVFNVVCGECKSTDITVDGYCTECGLQVVTNPIQIAQRLWEFGAIYEEPESDFGARRNRILVPWVEVTNQPLMDMLDFPSATVNLLAERRVTWQIPHAGMYTRAKMWNPKNWRKLTRRLLKVFQIGPESKKCREAGCAEFVYRHSSGYISQFGLCKFHLRKRRTALRTMYQQRYRKVHL